MAARLRLAALLACTVACSAGTVACSAGMVARPKVTYTPAEGVTRTPSPRAPETVEIRALGAPERAHAIVGRLVAHADEDDRVEREQLMHGLRERAAELGCDAVLLEPPFEEQKRVRFRYEYLTITRPILHGACIVHE